MDYKDAAARAGLSVNKWRELRTQYLATQRRGRLGEGQDLHAPVRGQAALFEVTK